MKVDQFESVFRAAAKEPYRYEEIHLERILVVTDQGRGPTEAFVQSARQLLGALGDEPSWTTLTDQDYTDVEALLGRVTEVRPDLIVTYRCLRSQSWKWPFTLGEHLDVLTQIAPSPVLVTPHPEAGRGSSHSMQNTDTVMAMTDHLAGDHRLVNFAVRLTQPGGRLLLAHIEDQHTFDRYMATIGKIDTIETDSAREEIEHQLLKEPADYIESCRQVLQRRALPITVGSHVAMGHHLTEYRRLLKEHQIDLLVMNTKDEDQLAMHGLAYPLAVELREIPLLLL